MSITKAHIQNLTKLIDNSKEKRQIEQLCNRERFLFTYNGFKDKSHNPSFDIKKFYYR